VIMEGIFLMSMRRVPLLARDLPVHVLQLVTPLDVCLAGVRERRARRGDERELSEKKTGDHYRTSQSFCAKMRFLGIPCEKVTRETAPGRPRAVLGLEQRS